MTTTHTLATGLHFAEGPRWHGGRFWFSDMTAHTVFSVGLDGDLRPEVRLDDDEHPSGLGWLPDGRLLLVAMVSRTVVRVEPDGTLTTVADLGHIATYHCNDMVVDDEGRAYVGNFGFDLDSFLDEHGVEGIIDEPKAVPASLALVEPDGTARAVANGLAFPNGMVITPDGDTLVVAQTAGFELTAFDRRPDGSLTRRRTWAPLATDDGAPIAPDGICLDAEGGIWVADAFGSGVHRVVEGGTITATVATTQTAFACMLGGPERRHLLACTAPSGNATQAAAAPDSRLEVVEVDVPGAGLP